MKSRPVFILLPNAFLGCALAACSGLTLPSSSPAAAPAARPRTGSAALNHPIGLAEDKGGNLYVANAGSSQILVYDSKNQQVPSKTITAGVDQPADLCFDKSGNLYASERSSNEVTVYSPAGKLIKTLDTDDSTGFSPSGVQIDSAGDVWVANRNNTNYDEGEVQVFDSSGKVIHSSSQELDYPLGIVFEGSDAWVFDSGADAITVFDSSAKVVKVISISGIAPEYAAKDSAGDLYVTDASSSSIGILSSSGKVLKTTQNKGLDNPTGIAFNKAGDFYVANEDNDTITEYSAKGDLIDTIQ
ncbi:MAG TPA: NHL repeat-containing protein [Candidatus Babeliales bacterium]|nr:NHL repeat-containing protein [Candidatus Babeliales bacterium]